MYGGGRGGVLNKSGAANSALPGSGREVSGYDEPSGDTGHQEDMRLICSPARPAADQPSKALWEGQPRVHRY